MGKRSRNRNRDGSDSPTGPLAGGLEPPFSLPPAVYRDPEAGELELRAVLTLKARAEYARTLSGGLNREDAWQRATELLFERLAVAWTIAGSRIEKQRELLQRYRVASVDERRFVRESLRAHLAENFPELEAP
jgi:hypothetical protein